MIDDLINVIVNRLKEINCINASSVCFNNPLHKYINVYIDNYHLIFIVCFEQLYIKCYIYNGKTCKTKCFVGYDELDDIDVFIGVLLCKTFYR